MKCKIAPQITLSRFFHEIKLSEVLFSQETTSLYPKHASDSSGSGLKEVIEGNLGMNNAVVVDSGYSISRNEGIYYCLPAFGSVCEYRHAFT